MMVKLAVPVLLTAKVVVLAEEIAMSFPIVRDPAVTEPCPVRIVK
jgi:hypothetical protein